MEIKAEVIERAIDNLTEAMRADDMVTESAHFYLSDSTFREIRENAKKHIAEAIESMKAVPSVGTETYWYLGCFPPLIKSDVPPSILHMCIYEAARDSYRNARNNYRDGGGYKFERPAPLPEITGELSKFVEDVSEEQKKEHELRCKFADLLDNITSWRIWDAMP